MVFLLSYNEVNKQLTCRRKEIITKAEQKTEQKKEEFLSILQVICLHPADWFENNDEEKEQQPPNT